MTASPTPSSPPSASRRGSTQRRLAIRGGHTDPVGTWRGDDRLERQKRWRGRRRLRHITCRARVPWTAMQPVERVQHTALIYASVGASCVSCVIGRRHVCVRDQFILWRAHPCEGLSKEPGVTSRAALSFQGRLDFSHIGFYAFFPQPPPLGRPAGESGGPRRPPLSPCFPRPLFKRPPTVLFQRATTVRQYAGRPQVRSRGSVRAASDGHPSDACLPPLFDCPLAQRP